ncbi:UDP-glycosyltransferase UGT43B1 precursor [Bombyx mori]|uniref:UDP-glucuronosyltransferase n=1 Tax=Bombyx mori TaxID=7091 RepID=G9LPV8_BOMMO|nr:UDP-glycosyltransferase UGT43B1 precursor [Bombyx mori]AEW43181.1 UDP-glycosyltransferase UGT43B1 [Bombyx mori]
MNFSLLGLFVFVNQCVSYKILAVFPYNGRSHHNLFSTLVEELALRDHSVTVVNYFPMKNISKLRQIPLEYKVSGSDVVDIDDTLKNLPGILVNFHKALDTARAFKNLANSNCNKLMSNKEIQGIISSKTKFDLVIVEQFVTDCGLAVAFKLNAPIVGITAHILMPWTYSRLGALNHPAYVPNHFIGSGTKPGFWDKIQSALINIAFNIYFKYVIQKSDQMIINSVFEDVPDLDEIGKNISLILLNQYFPLTGSRLYGANVIEVGGLHIKENTTIDDEEIKSFIDKAESDVIYISFGTVASNFPDRIIKEIINFITKSSVKVLWKIDNVGNLNLPKNVLIRKWFPQTAVLCHPKVKAFITHSGMLSSIEAMHCGVPVISVPLFGDQFANAAAATEIGLGVTIDVSTMNERKINQALKTVMQDSYQIRAQNLSALWRDRPVSPLNLAIFWIEYVIRHKGNVELRPPTVDLGFYELLMLDVCGMAIGILISFCLFFSIIISLIRFIRRRHINPNKTKTQ